MGTHRRLWAFAALILAAIVIYGARSSSPGILTGTVRWIGVIFLACAFTVALSPALGNPLKKRSGEVVDPLAGISVFVVAGLAFLWMGIDNDSHPQASPPLKPGRQVSAAPQSGTPRQSQRTSAEHERQRRVADEALIVGRWIDPKPYGLGVAVIKRSGKSYVLLAEPTEIKHYEIPLAERDRHKHRRFYMVDAHYGDWYEILDDGRLQTGDKEGKSEILEVAQDGADNTDARAEMLFKAKDDYKCEHAIDCVAQNFLFVVPEVCDPLIERQARYQYRWTDGLLDGPKYSGRRWNPKHGQERHLVDFYGDKLELQNAFGAWSNYVYVCTINVQSDAVMSVKLAQGRL